MRDMPSAGRGVYGLWVRGLDRVVELMPGDGPTGNEPVVEVRQDAGGHPPPPVPPDARRAVLQLAEGRHLALDRDRRTATFYGPTLTDDLLAHPYLGAVASTFHRWAGLESFHAGAFLRSGRAWAVLGPRTAGKSSLLAVLASRGVPVVSDDLLVVDGVAGFAGPRCVDLRQPIPGLAIEARPVRGDTRLRVGLPPVAAQVPLGGWFFLHWGEALALRPLPATELLARLAGTRLWPGLRSEPARLLALATLPAWDLLRPRDWGAVGDTCELLDTVTAPAFAGVPR